MQLAEGLRVAGPCGWSSLATAAIIIALAASLRTAAAWHDLWLDEIWSLLMVDRFVSSPVDLLRGAMKHDNNHLLNSLYLAALGPHRPPIMYRIPAIATGSAGVVAAWLLGRQRGLASGWSGGIAFAISYPLVSCGSEARGYPLMSLFLLVAQWAALEAFEARTDRGVADHSMRLPVTFTIASVLGILSHLTFVMGYLGLLVWTSWQVWRRGGPVRERLRALLAWHVVPLVVVLWQYVFFVRGMTAGRGPGRTLFATACDGLSALAGGPVGGGAAIACGLAVAVLGGGCLLQCWRDRPARGWFFLLSIVGAPAAVLGLFPAEHLAIRYLIVPLQTLLLLIAEEVPVFVVTQRAARRPWAAAIAVALSVAVGAANALRDGVLISRGRGAYREFLKAVAAESHWPGATITAASDSHFRNTLLVSYHQENAEGRGIRLVDEAELPKWGSEWYFLLDTRDGMPPRPQVTDRHGNRYTFAGETRGGGLSASHWQVYRNQHGPWPAEERP